MVCLFYLDLYFILFYIAFFPQIPFSCDFIAYFLYIRFFGNFSRRWSSCYYLWSISRCPADRCWRGHSFYNSNGAVSYNLRLPFETSQYSSYYWQQRWLLTWLYFNEYSDSYTLIKQAALCATRLWSCGAFFVLAKSLRWPSCTASFITPCSLIIFISTLCRSPKRSHHPSNSLPAKSGIASSDLLEPRRRLRREGAPFHHHRSAQISRRM